MVAWEREAAVSAIPLIEQATHRSGQCNRSNIITVLRTEESELFNFWTTSSLLFCTIWYIPLPIMLLSNWRFTSLHYIRLTTFFFHIPNTCTEGALRLPMTYDNRPNPFHLIPSNPQSFFNNFNRPWIDLSQPPMTSNDLQWLTDWLLSANRILLGGWSSRTFDLLL